MPSQPTNRGTMRRLLKYVTPYKWFAMLAPLFMGLEVGLELLQPRLMSRIIDDGVAKGDMGVILLTCLYMLGTSCLAVVGGVGCTFFSSLAGQNFGADLREELFGRVLGLSFAETDRFTSGSLITRITQDINHLQHFLVMCMRMFVRQPLMCIGGCVMALMIDLRLAVIMLVMIPPILGLAILGYRIGRPLFSKIQEKVDALNGAIQGNLAGIRVVKAFFRGSYEKERFDKSNRDLADQYISVRKCMSALMPFTMFVMNMGMLCVLYVGGLSVRKGTMTVGEVMAMLSYITQILFSFMAMAFMLRDFARAKVSADRICEVMDARPSVLDSGTGMAEKQGGAELEFRDVSFRYPGASGSPVIEGLSFRLKPGCRLAILGATGSGKSTVAHLIPRFYDCDSGSILLDGRDVRDYKLSELRSAIAIVLQDAVLFSGTVDENIRWGSPDADTKSVHEAASLARADEYIAKFKDGFDTVVGQRGVTLSGGQKQRLAIARALLKKPRLLILDDCASALDVATEQALRTSLNQNLGDTTVLLIAQRVSSVRDADAIMILSDGRCAGIGTHEELLKSCQVYREIVSSQTGEELEGVDNA